MIINANALHIPLASQSVHMAVTSPPYWGLRDYGVGGQLGLEATPEEYVANMVAVFREVWRVLRDDGVLFLNIGDSYGSPPGRNDTDRQGIDGFTGSKGKYGSDKIKQSRNSITTNLKPKDLVGIPWRVAFALQADGWYLRSDIIWSKPNPMPESVTDRPTKAHEYIFLLTKRSRYFWDAEAVKEGLRESSIERSGYGWSGKVIIDNDGIERRSQPDITEQMGDRWAPPAGRNIRTVWEIATQSYKGAHYATFPTALVEPCVKAGTSERGVCPKCGAPWVRVVERINESTWQKRKELGATGGAMKEGPRQQVGTVRTGDLQSLPTRENTTLGWRPSCECDGVEIIEDQPTKPSKKELLPEWELKITEWYQKWEILNPIYEKIVTIPATVFDPFVGSGTTVQVAYDLGRRGVGLDLSLEYLTNQAHARIHNGHTGRLL